jgi:hypothetical protein
MARGKLHNAAMDLQHNAEDREREPAEEHKHTVPCSSDSVHRRHFYPRVLPASSQLQFATFQHRGLRLKEGSLSANRTSFSWQQYRKNAICTSE